MHVNKITWPLKGICSGKKKLRTDSLKEKNYLDCKNWPLRFSLDFLKARFLLGFFWGERRKKLGRKRIFPGCLAPFFFWPVLWSEVCRYCNESEITTFGYFTQKEVVTSLTFCANFNKINSISCKQNMSTSRRLSFRQRAFVTSYLIFSLGEIRSRLVASLNSPMLHFVL